MSKSPLYRLSDLELNIENRRMYKVDPILELFSMYDCHLKRNGQSMLEFLSENFKNYIDDLKKACDSENIIIGNDTVFAIKRELNEIEKNANAILEILKLYNDGRIVVASIKAFDLFDKMKPYLTITYTGNFRKESYYRIRVVKENNLEMTRKDLFHIPRNLNYLAGSERYSMPGHPCLYLASQLNLCWFECGKPQMFYCSKFDVPQQSNNTLKLIDFSQKMNGLSYSFVAWFHNEKNRACVINYLVKHIYCYPLRAACSVVKEHVDGKFNEEYIISQLLLQWIHNNDFVGIKYESCKAFYDVDSLGGHNLVLLTKRFDNEGYDVDLRKQIKVGIPIYVESNKILEEEFLSLEKKSRNLEFI